MNFTLSPDEVSYLSYSISSLHSSFGDDWGLFTSIRGLSSTDGTTDLRLRAQTCILPRVQTIGGRSDSLSSCDANGNIGSTCTLKFTDCNVLGGGGSSLAGATLYFSVEERRGESQEFQIVVEEIDLSELRSGIQDGVILEDENISAFGYRSYGPISVNPGQDTVIEVTFVPHDRLGNGNVDFNVWGAPGISSPSGSCNFVQRCRFNGPNGDTDPCTLRLTTVCDALTSSGWYFAVESNMPIWETYDLLVEVKTAISDPVQLDGGWSEEKPLGLYETLFFSIDLGADIYTNGTLAVDFEVENRNRVDPGQNLLEVFLGFEEFPSSNCQDRDEFDTTAIQRTYDVCELTLEGSPQFFFLSVKLLRAPFNNSTTNITVRARSDIGQAISPSQIQFGENVSAELDANNNMDWLYYQITEQTNVGLNGDFLLSVTDLYDLANQGANQGAELRAYLSRDYLSSQGDCRDMRLDCTNGPVFTCSGVWSLCDFNSQSGDFYLSFEQRNPERYNFSFEVNTIEPVDLFPGSQTSFSGSIQDGHSSLFYFTVDSSIVGLRDLQLSVTTSNGTFGDLEVEMELLEERLDLTSDCKGRVDQCFATFPSFPQCSVTSNCLGESTTRKYYVRLINHGAEEAFFNLTSDFQQSIPLDLGTNYTAVHTEDLLTRQDHWYTFSCPTAASILVTTWIDPNQTREDFRVHLYRECRQELNRNCGSRDCDFELLDANAVSAGTWVMLIEEVAGPVNISFRVESPGRACRPFSDFSNFSNTSLTPFCDQFLPLDQAVFPNDLLDILDSDAALTWAALSATSFNISNEVCRNNMARYVCEVEFRACDTDGGFTRDVCREDCEEILDSCLFGDSVCQDVTCSQLDYCTQPTTFPDGTENQQGTSTTGSASYWWVFIIIIIAIVALVVIIGGAIILAKKKH